MIEDLEAKDIFGIILGIANSIKNRGPMLNERYLHHFFSHLIQQKYGLLSLNEKDSVICLHPEWPTYKKSTCLKYGRYRNQNGKYMPSESGTSGWIDFAIGNYKRPHIGIEFCLKYGWSDEEVVYDFLKLLDGRNPFKASISYNVIFRERALVRGGFLKDLEQHMEESYKEAVKRLDVNVCDDSRELCFIVTEVDKDDKRRHWHYDRTSGGFKEGLPPIA